MARRIDNEQILTFEQQMCLEKQGTARPKSICGMSAPSLRDWGSIYWMGRPSGFV